jgi:hypothetical protein
VTVREILSSSFWGPPQVRSLVDAGAKIAGSGKFAYKKGLMVCVGYG